jgi:hypothetical protein
MRPYRSAAQVEADLLALRASAERAGAALACVFSTSAEYEADLINTRRAEGAYGSQRPHRGLAFSILITLLLACAFLML